MILIDVEIYNHSKRRYELFEAIVDTGATFCALAKHLADEIAVPFLGSMHLWQVNGPLTLTKIKLTIKYRESELRLDGVIVELPQDYLRLGTREEKCKRPLTPHPLSNRIIVGKNFLETLSEEERRQIASYLVS